MSKTVGTFDCDLRIYPPSIDADELARIIMHQDEWTYTKTIRESLEKTAEATTDTPTVLTAAYLEKLITYATVRIEGTEYENS